MKLINNFFENINFTLSKLDKNRINDTIKLFKKIRNNQGRLFIIGIGGSAETLRMQLMTFENYVILMHILQLIIYLKLQQELMMKVLRLYLIHI